MILGSWLLKTEIGTHFYIKQLIAENRYVICDNWRDKKSNVSINNIRYHCTECTYSENGEDYVFTSDIYHPNLQPFANGDKVKVYVDLFNPKVYYVSFEKVTDNYY